MREPLNVTRDIDPYPTGQRLFPMSDSLDERNLRNIYVLARRGETVAT